MHAIVKSVHAKKEIRRVYIQGLIWHLNKVKCKELMF